MPRKYTRKLTVTGEGKSYYLIIPREIIKDLGWKKGEKKVVFQKGKGVMVEDWKK